MDELFSLRQIGKGVWRLTQSPQSQSREDQLFEGDLEGLVPGRAILEHGDGRRTPANVLFWKRPGSTSAFIKSSALVEVL